MYKLLKHPKELIMKPLIYKTMTLLFSLCIISGCKGNYSTNVVNLDTMEIIEMDSTTSDYCLTPIKCSVPMDGIVRTIDYSDYTFYLGRSRKKIYCIENDTVIGILESVGRGRGEYVRIEDYCYDERQKLLYVVDQKRILKYSVPSMEFIESIDINFTTSGMIALDTERLLIKCSYFTDDTYNNLYDGVCIVSSKTGEILKQCLKFDYYSTFCFMKCDFQKDGNNVLLPMADPYINRIVSFDLSNYSTKEIESFSFNPRWRLSKKMTRLLKKDHIKFEIDFDDEFYCNGCHFPSFINSRLTYWCYAIENGKNNGGVVIKSGDETICRLFNISGTNILVSPDYVKDNKCYSLIEGETESIIEDWDELSPLGREIYETMKAQPFNNPVLLSFTVDKGL